LQVLDCDTFPEFVDRFVGGDADDKHGEKCNRGMHRSETFRQAQLKPIDEPTIPDPAIRVPFILIGSWQKKGRPPLGDALSHQR